MRCIVSGATGCLGSNLTARLLKEGHDVIALGRNVHLGYFLQAQGAQFVALDLAQQKEELQILTKDADVVFHCAALSSPWGRYRDFYQANVLGTQHMLAATPASARFIHVSTPSIYFAFRSQYNLHEDASLPDKPANAYVATKLIAETLVDKAVQEGRIQAITLRPRGIFGPCDRAIFPRILNAERGGRLPLIGSGDQLVDLTYVSNVVDSMLLAVTAPMQYCGRKYNITNDEPMPMVTLLTMLYHALKKPLHIKKLPYALMKWFALADEMAHHLPGMRGEPRLTRYTAGVLAFGQTLNIQAAKKDLAYHPQIRIAEGMEHYARWYYDAL